jgi:hypothetical protein
MKNPGVHRKYTKIIGATQGDLVATATTSKTGSNASISQAEIGEKGRSEEIVDTVMT